MDSEQRKQITTGSSLVPFTIPITFKRSCITRTLCFVTGADTTMLEVTSEPSVTHAQAWPKPVAHSLISLRRGTSLRGGLCVTLCDQG